MKVKVKVQGGLVTLGGSHSPETEAWLTDQLWDLGPNCELLNGGEASSSVF